MSQDDTQNDLGVDRGSDDFDQQNSESLPIFDDVGLDFDRSQTSGSNDTSLTQGQDQGLEGVTEETFLLPKPQRAKTNLRYKLLSIIPLFCGVLVISWFFILSPFISTSQNVFASICEFELQHAELNEINESGLVYSIQGDLSFNYSKIENKVTRKFYNVIGDYVNFIKINDIQHVTGHFEYVRFNDDHEVHNYDSLEMFYVPQVSSVNLTFDGTKSSINLFKQEILFDAQNTTLFLNDILNYYEHNNLKSLELRLRLHVERIALNTKKDLTSLNIHKNFKIDMDSLRKILLESEKKYFSTSNELFEVKELKIFQQFDDLFVNAAFSLQFISPMILVENLRINSISWQILIKDYSDKLVKLAILTIDDFQIVNNKLENVKISVKIGKLNTKLVTVPKRKELSVINKFLSDLLKAYDPNDYLVLYCKVLDSHNFQWLDDVLTRLKIPINLNELKYFLADYLDASKLIDFNQLVQSISAKNLEVLLPDDIDQHSSIIVSEGQIDGVLNVSPIFQNVELGVDKAGGKVTVSHNKKPILNIKTQSMQKSMLNIDYLSRLLTFNLTLFEDFVSFGDTEQLNTLVKSIINNHSKEVIAIDSVVDFNLQNFKTINNGQDYLFKKLPVGLDFPVEFNISKSMDFLRQSEVIIRDVIYLSSTMDTISVIVDVSVFYPKFFTEFVTVFENNNLIDLHLVYGGAVLGSVLLQDLLYNGTEAGFSNISLLVELSPIKTPLSLYNQGLTNLLNAYISDEGPILKLRGHSKSLVSSKEISQIFKDVEVDVMLPSYDCPVVSKKNNNGFWDWFKPSASVSHVGFGTGLIGGRSGRQGFILSVTIHLMTSEIEFELFNPMKNSAIMVTVHSGKALYRDDNADEIELAHLRSQTSLEVPPGLYKSPRLPIVYDNTGIAGDILRRALNRDLITESRVICGVKIGSFERVLNYSGSGVLAIISL